MLLSKSEENSFFSHECDICQRGQIRPIFTAFDVFTPPALYTDI